MAALKTMNTYAARSRTNRIAELLGVRLSTLIWELPFWIGLLVWCLLPTTRTPWFNIGGMNLNGRDLSVVLIAGIFFMTSVVYSLKTRYPQQRYLRFIKRPPPAYLYHLPSFTMLIFIYMAVSVFWNNRSTRDSIAMLYTLLGAASAFYVSYSMIKDRSPETIRRVLWWMTIIMAAVGMLYSSESLFSLGLRTAEKYASEFGIDRVKGPLFASSNGFFVLLPALAFSVQAVVHEKNPRARLLKLVPTSALLLTTISLGSRGALLLLGIFFILLFFSLRGKQRFYIFLICIVISIGAMSFVFARANTSRLQTLDDDGRSATHRISGIIISERDFTTNVFGSGYGSYWAWYLQETDYQDDRYEEWKHLYRSVSTPYGRMLYHPHSAMLLLAVEGGLIGIGYFVTLWSVLIRNLLKGFAGAPYAIFAAGMAASGFALLFDLFIFRFPALNVIWWTYILGALRLNYQLPAPKTSLVDKLNNETA